MTKIAIAGWFGSGNFGDELLLDTVIDAVGQAFHDSDILVFGADPQRVSESHRTEARPLTGNRNIRRLGELPNLVVTLRACDALILGPGTIFQERGPHLRWPGTLPPFVLLALAASIARIPIIVAGVGMREGGTVLGHTVLRMLTLHAKAVGVRDHETRVCLGSMAKVTGDLALASSLVQEAPEPRQAGAFGVSLRPIGRECESLKDWADCAIASLEERGLRGRFFEFSRGLGAVGESDSLASSCQRWLEHIPAPLDSFLQRDQLTQWARTFASNEIVLAMRLHAVVLATAMGIPTIALGYEKKVSRYMRDAGLSRFLIEPGSLCDPDELVMEALGSGPVFRAARTRLLAQGRDARSWLVGALWENIMKSQ